MHPSVVPLAATFRLNTELLLNCLDGVSAAQMRSMPAGGCNHMASLTAHLVESRHHALSLMGHSTSNPLAPFLHGAKSQTDGTLPGNLAFLSQHDSYHLGQLGLLRRQLGLPAMTYALRPREPGRLGA